MSRTVQILSINHTEQRIGLRCKSRVWTILEGAKTVHPDQMSINDWRHKRGLTDAMAIARIQD